MKHVSRSSGLSGRSEGFIVILRVIRASAVGSGDSCAALLVLLRTVVVIAMHSAFDSQSLTSPANFRLVCKDSMTLSQEWRRCSEYDIRSEGLCITQR